MDFCACGRTRARAGAFVAAVSLAHALWAQKAPVAPPTDASPDSAVAALERMVVYGSTQQFLLETPQSLVVVSPQEWAGTCKTVADVLAEHTGIQTRRFGGLGSFQTVSVRGVEGSEVLVLLDGIPLNTALGGAVDLGKINPARLKAVEVYKGVVPSRYGGNSLGGVIDLKTVDKAAGSAADVHVSLAAYGRQEHQLLVSHAPLQRVHLFGMLAFSHAANDFRYVDRNSTPYNLDDDRVTRLRNAAATQGSLLLHPSIEVAGGRTLVSAVSATLSRTELPAFEDKTNYTASYEENLVTLHVRLRDDRQEAAFAFEPALGYTYSDGLRFVTSLDEGVGASHSTQTAPNSYTELGAVEQTLAIPLTARWRPVDLLTVEPSVHIVAADINPTVNTTQGTHGDWHSREAVAYGATDITLAGRGLRVATGASVKLVYSQTEGGLDGASLRTVPASDTLTILWSARSGLSASLFDRRLLLYVNAGRYSNQPSLRERYGARGAHNPNPTLVPETGLSLEAGGKLRRGGLYAELAGFLIRSYDKIITVFDGYQSSSVNCEGARSYGVEGWLMWRPLSWLAIDSRATLQHTENLTRQYNWNGTRLPNEPAADLFEQVTVGPFKGGSLRYGLHMRSYYYLNPGNKSRVPAEPLDGSKADMWEVRHQFALEWKAPKHLSIILSANNVTNKFITEFETAYPGETNYSWVAVPMNQWKIEAGYSF